MMTRGNISSDSEILSAGKGQGKGGVTQGAGNITFNVGTFHLNGTPLESFEDAKEGNVDDIEGRISSSQVDKDGLGNAGTITIQGQGGAGTFAESVVIEGGGLLTQVGVKLSGEPVNIPDPNDPTNPPKFGSGGNINIHAVDFSLFGGLIQALASTPGEGGNLNLDLQNQFTSTNSLLNTQSTSGTGGSMMVAAHTATLNNTIATASVTGGIEPGGDITFTTVEQATFIDSTIEVKSEGLGNAGDILLDGGNTALFESTIVSAEALQSSGGNIKVDAVNMIFANNSTFIADVKGDALTAGGTISLDPHFIILRNSQLLATALFGSGGTVELIADVILIDPTSVIDVSSQFGTSGTVTVSSPIQNLSGAIAPLPESIVDVAQLVGARCAAQQGGKLSTFVEAGRDVIPPGPGDYLTSPLFLDQPSQGNLQGLHKGTNNLAAQRLGMTVGQELTTWLNTSDSLHFTGSTRCYVSAMKKA